MLYIFHVDIGRMLTFDMNLALESVQFLKETIERHHSLPASSQVLLVSGGEMLQSTARVCSYSAGTDTNPIFMFSTNVIESQNPPKPWPSIESDTDVKDKIDQCLSLPANYSTVVTRAQLAQQVYELAKDETKICEKLVHEQHLQQQGWAAVVANMEDITEEFKERCDDFYRSFDEHLEQRPEYLEFVSHFNDDLDNLAKIPILPSLISCAEEKPFHAFDDFLNESESFPKSVSSGECSQSASQVNPTEPIQINSKIVDSTEKKSNMTLSLLQWISASENQKAFRHLAHNCTKGLQLFEEKAMSTLKAEAKKAIDAAQQDNMKEIKGLEDRLCGLEKLMFDAKKIVQEQCELAQAIQNNQIRANNLGDASILPDLCASHCSQLMVMSKNHKLLRDIRRRVTKAKEELATNLNRRLKYVVYIENRMYDIDNSLLFYHRCLRRLQSHLGIIEQIHKAPCMYVSAVTEVVRRRVFSSAFLMWASTLACQLLTIYNEEVMRRHDFSSIFEGHFLSTLFPGMNDMPPSFATEAPSIFDAGLPQLSKEDLNLLSIHLPEMTSKIQLPDLDTVINFFSSRSGVQTSNSKSTEFEQKSNVEDQQEIPKQCSVQSLLKEYETHCTYESYGEEIVEVGSSSLEKEQQAACIGDQNIKTETSTDTLTTHTNEASSEVRNTNRNNIYNIDDVTNDTKRSTNYFPQCSISYNSLSSSNSPSSVILAVPPKKPPRSHKILIPSNKPLSSNETLHHSFSYSFISALPTIPEIFPSTKYGPKFRSSSTTSSDYTSSESSPDITNDMGHQNIKKKLSIKLEQEIKEEFINSDFYIDESLPSSYDSDRQEECIMNDLIMAGKNNLHDNNQLNDETVLLLLQDNLGSTRLEVEKLKYLLKVMSELSRNSLFLLKQQVLEFRNKTEISTHGLKLHLDEVNRLWNTKLQNIKTNDEKVIFKLKKEHEQELHEIKKFLENKKEVISELENVKSVMEVSHFELKTQYQSENSTLKQSVEELRSKVSELENQILNASKDKEKAVSDIRDRLINEHKTEIESLRCRFKLMTYMERSPSDTSLETIERPDYIDLPGNDPNLRQSKEDVSQGRDRRIDCRRSSQIHPSNSPKSPTLNPSQDLYRKILEEKERQIDTLRERETIILKENMKFKQTIQSIADSEPSGEEISILKNQFENLQQEKKRIEEELDSERAKRVEMEKSVSALKSETINKDITTSPEPSRSRTRLSTSQSTQFKMSISFDTCTKGDYVLVVWNSFHGQYTIVQDSSVLFFLHGDSYETLNLSAPQVPGEAPKTIFCIGVVVEKEYCHARKDENRYKVSKGTKFYRVKVNPKKSDTGKVQKKERLVSGGTSTSSESVSRSTSTEKCNQPFQFIDSFAQTEILDPVLEDIVSSSGKDMIDSGVVTQQKSIYKERNISVTEEDEPLAEERCYVDIITGELSTHETNVSEEDDENHLQKSSTENPLQIQDEIDEDSGEYRSLDAFDQFYNDVVDEISIPNQSSD